MAKPAPIDLAFIKRALKFGGRIDASDLVLGIKGGKVVVSDPESGAHRPPFLIAAHEYEAGSSPDTPGSWDVHKFERLSLAARVALMTASSPSSRRTMGLQEKARSERFDLAAFPEVDPVDILEALAWVADELGPDQGKEGLAKTDEQLAMRSGLQLIGCRIKARQRTVDGVLTLSRDGLRLVNARLPISLRLIGCVIECPVLLAHCELVSLDLSGSAMDSLDATGLKASGSVYLRRSVIRTPVSFAGAKIAGSFNASDAVLAPFAKAAEQTPLDPDHGMLNLSKTTIDNEVRMERIRVWGGLSLRGATIGRTVFLDNALLISPLAMLGKHLGDLLKPCGEEVEVPDELTELREADGELAKRLHSNPQGSPPPDAERLALEAMEVLEGETDRWRQLTSRTLLKLTSRALMAALRADGVRIEGSVFARSVRSYGLVRMKYANVVGTVHFEGSRLRSAQSCEDAIKRTLATHGVNQALERVEARALLEEMAPTSEVVAALEALGRGETERAVAILDQSKRPWRFKQGWDDIVGNERFFTDWDPSVAFDLRDGVIQGNLSLGNAITMEEDQRQADTLIDQDGPRPATAKPDIEIDGRLFLSGLQVSGSVLMQRLVQRPPPPRAKPEVDAANTAHSAASSSSQTVSVRKGSSLKRWANLLSFPKENNRDKTWSEAQRTAMQTARNCFSIQLGQIRIGRDLDLRGAKFLRGVDLENAEVGGDLRFADKSSGRMPRTGFAGFIECQNRAEKVSGTVNLRSIEVAGDAFLVFDPRTGPNLLAGMASIGGRLDIYPQEGAQSYQRRIDRTFPDDKTGFWLDTCWHKAKPVRGADDPPGRICRECGLMMDKVDDHLAWFIDLRHARATVFAHPPAAWPDPGALSLDGFSYEQSSDLGPLAPKPPLVDLEDDHYERVRQRYVWRYHPGHQFFWNLMLVLLGLAVWMTLAWVLFLGLGWVSNSNQAAVAPVPAYLGCLLVMTLPLIRLLFLEPGLQLQGTWPFVRNEGIAPRALEYLKRQRVAESRFKWRPAGYHVLDTYVRAAKALRNAGRYISANIVEEERLRLRTEMLSWRHHGPIKAMLNLVDAFAGYGFRLSRAFLLTMVLWFSIAAVAHSAAAAGLLTRQPDISIAADGSVEAKPADRKPCGQARSVSAVDQDCPDFLYASDLLLPFADLGEETRWRPSMGPWEGELRKYSEPWRSLLASLVLSWPGMVKLLGLLLTGVIGAAAAARIESAFARVEE